MNDEVRILGTGTWNDEQSETLLFNGANQASYRRSTIRRHLRRNLADLNEYTALRTAVIGSDRAAIAAAIQRLKTGEMSGSGQPLDADIDAIAQEFGTTGGSEWTLAVTRDQSLRDGVIYFFEISRETVVP